MTKRPHFEPGKSYPIEDLPDDLYDETIPNRDRWSIRTVLFWNDCQGWWTEGVSEYWLHSRDHHVARFWQPLPVDPMTREQILAERGMVVCEHCDLAIELGKPHNCRPSNTLARERELQRLADAAEGEAR